MANLKGIRVALLEARMTSELAELVRRQGGEPYSVPAVREMALESGPQVAEFIDRLSAGGLPVVIFSTGVGARRLFEAAGKLGRLDELLDALKTTTTVCRGPKPIAALKRAGVQINLSAKEPHTTTQVLEILEQVELKGVGVGLQHYGERNTALADALEARGANLSELTLYEWLMPEDLQPLNSLVQEIIEGKVDAVAFTSQIQIRHLFEAAGDRNREALANALNHKVVVASVGPTCTSVLNGFGVSPHVMPEHPKMGSMVLALVDYIDKRSSAR